MAGNGVHDDLPPAAWIPLSLLSTDRVIGTAVLTGIERSRYRIKTTDPCWTNVSAGVRIRLKLAGCRSHPLFIRTCASNEGHATLVLEHSRARRPGAFENALAREFMAAGASSQDLTAYGLPSPRLSEEVVYRRAQSHELGQILHLRTQAYRHAGKYSGDGTLTDAFDADAIHLCAFFRGIPVAAIRLMIHPPGAMLEEEQFFKWTSELPDRSDVIEISRACVHPDFQRCKVLEGLFRRVVIEVLQSRRNWVLGTATDRLLPMYQRLGCQATSIRFRYGALEGIEHTVFVSNVRSGMLGRTHLLTWLFFWSRVSRTLTQDGLLVARTRAEYARLVVLSAVARLIPGGLR